MNKANALFDGNMSMLLERKSSTSAAAATSGPPSFPGPLDKSKYRRSSSDPESGIPSPQLPSRRRSSPSRRRSSSTSNYSNSSLPTAIFMQNSSMSSTASWGAVSTSSSSKQSRDAHAQARTSRKVDVVIAKCIASDAKLYTTQLVDNHHLFKNFQSKLTKNGTVTNLAAREMLRNDVMNSKCYVTEKQYIRSHHEAKEAEAAQGTGGGAVRGMKRVLTSAFSLDTLAGLKSECSTSNFDNVDLAEQHAIMSEIMVSRAAATTSATSRRRSSSTISAGVCSDSAYHASYAGDLYGSQSAVPTAAQVLASSLGNQVRRISTSLSSVAKGDHVSNGSSGNSMCYHRSSSIPSVVTSSTAPSSVYGASSPYHRSSSLSNISRRSSMESTNYTSEMNLNDLKNLPSDMSYTSINPGEQTSRRQSSSRRLSNLRMSFLAFDDVFEEDLHEVSDEDQPTSGSDANGSEDHIDASASTAASARSSSAQLEMDAIAERKLQSAVEIQAELLGAFPHQIRAVVRRRGSMASNASSNDSDEANIRKARAA